ncbi:MAG: DUF2304 domain-containing protein [Anaerolineae bacterium]|nr:DUF2304 domain-containing protein [Anaerolineae bacterium]
MFTNIPRVEVIMIAGPALMLLIVLELVRRRRLREDYSLLWLITFGVLVVLSLFRNSLLEMISGVMGIAYPPTALFVIGFGLMLLVMIQFSVVITRLTRENKEAAQHIALLSTRVRELERKHESESENKA